MRSRSRCRSWLVLSSQITAGGGLACFFVKGSSFLRDHPTGDTRGRAILSSCPSPGREVHGHSGSFLLTRAAGRHQISPGITAMGRMARRHLVIDMPPKSQNCRHDECMRGGEEMTPSGTAGPAARRHACPGGGPHPCSGTASRTAGTGRQQVLEEGCHGPVRSKALRLRPSAPSRRTGAVRSVNVFPFAGELTAPNKRGVER